MARMPNPYIKTVSTVVVVVGNVMSAISGFHWCKSKISLNSSQLSFKMSAINSFSH